MTAFNPDLPFVSVLLPSLCYQIEISSPTTFSVSIILIDFRSHIKTPLTYLFIHQAQNSSGPWFDIWLESECDPVLDVLMPSYAIHACQMHPYAIIVIRTFTHLHVTSDL